LKVSHLYQTAKLPNPMLAQSPKCSTYFCETT
jgi:hypothetical protein